MNVLQTQHSIFRLNEVSALVAQQQQAGELAQRQQALSADRTAAHAAASVAQTKGSAESGQVGERQTAEQDSKQGRRRRSDSGRSDAKQLKDALNPGPLGHRLDITA